MRIEAKYRYDAFGVPKPGVKLDIDANGFINPYGYNSEDYDMYSGLQYLRARYYEPETGRFMTNDSYLGNEMNPLTLNRYDYASNNPVMNVDPSGHRTTAGSSQWDETEEERTNSIIAEGMVLEEESGYKVPMLQMGSRGEEVRKLQQQLMDLGYYVKGGADGDFGPGTRNAVEQFQRVQGIGTDGIVGNQTTLTLRTAKSMKNKEYMASLIAKNNPGSSIQDKIKERQQAVREKECGALSYLTKPITIAYAFALTAGIVFATNPDLSRKIATSFGTVGAGAGAAKIANDTEKPITEDVVNGAAEAVHVKAPQLVEGSQWQRDVLNSFKGGEAVEKTYGEGTTLYRVGGNNGRFWSLDPPPATEYEWRVNTAIKQEFCNDGSTLYKMTVPKGSSISGLDGIVGPQGNGLYGGAHQIYIDFKAVPESWIQTSPTNFIK